MATTISPISSYISMGGSLIGSLFSAMGNSALEDANNYLKQTQANIARLNAQVMENRAQQTLRSAETEAVSYSLQAGRTKSKQKASMAANGIAIGEGSAAEMRASTDIVKTMDLNTIKKNATAKAWGYRWAATNEENKALAAEASQTHSAFGTTLMSGVSQVANKYALYSAMGVYDSPKVASNTISSGYSAPSLTMTNLTGLDLWRQSNSWKLHGLGMGGGSSVGGDFWS